MRHLQRQILETCTLANAATPCDVLEMYSDASAAISAGSSMLRHNCSPPPTEMEWGHVICLMSADARCGGSDG